MSIRVMVLINIQDLVHSCDDVSSDQTVPEPKSDIPYQTECWLEVVQECEMFPTMPFSFEYIAMKVPWAEVVCSTAEMITISA